MKSENFSAISLFSGALGLDLGIKRSGFDIRLAVEIDKTACKTASTNCPELNLIEGDVSKLSGKDILEKAGIIPGKLTLLFGGAPCQSFSTAGRRLAFNDSRGNLILEFIRLVSETRPDYFILENVRGILSAAIRHRPISDRTSDYPSLEEDEQQGSVLKYMYELFGELGYTTHHKLLMAANYGVPQKRERVFFIGSKYGELVPFPEPTHAEKPDLFARPWLTLGDALAGLIQPQVEAFSYSETYKQYFQLVPPGGNWRNLPKELQAKALGGAYTSTGGRVGFFRRLSFDEPCPTLLTSPIQKGTALCHPTELRPLSIAEYARIQQFPDDWEFKGSLNEKYKQIGNAVPIGLAESVGKALREYISNRNGNKGIFL